MRQLLHGHAFHVIHGVFAVATSESCFIGLQVEGTSSVVSELAKLATQEQMLLDQSRDLLSMVAAIHVWRISVILLFDCTLVYCCLAHCVNYIFEKQVKQCSLQAHMLQRKQKQSQTRV